jgi:hypothetical protein
MLVHLRQYKHEGVDIDDERTSGESQTEDAVDKDPEEYFGGDLDLAGATWETVEHRGDPVQRREVELDGVTAVSMPDDEDGESDLPGQTVQIRYGGGVEHLENAVLVEAEDANP